VKVWLYAFRQGIRHLIVAEVALAAASLVTFLIFNGFCVPTVEQLEPMLGLAIGLVLLLPLFVVCERFVVWRNHQKKVS
jgi:hypothetical protein